MAALCGLFLVGPPGVNGAPLTYTNVEDLGLYGKGFTDTLTFYDRLPGAAKGVVSGAVWGLSLDNAGMYAQFETDSSEIAVQATLRSSSLTMWHFPSTGVAGLDLYLMDTSSNVWRWIGTTRTIEYPKAFTNTMLIGGHPTVGNKTGLYRLHLPLYNGMANLSIGTQHGSTIKNSPPDFKYKGAVVWYGTSIAQGGVASRPGQAFTNVIGRDLGLDMYNFGFSGHGLMEADVAEFLVKIPDISVFIVDCLPNMQSAEVANRTIPLVKQIASAHPTAQIILAEGTTYGAAWYNAGVAAAQTAKRAALKKAYQDLVASGMKQLHYVNGNDLMCIDPPNCYVNPTVGGTHPSDLGMRAIANYYKRFLPSILKENDGSYKPSAKTWQPLGLHDPSAVLNDLSDEKRLEYFRSALLPNQPELADPFAMEFKSLTELTVRGRAFNNTAEFFNRLPAAAKGVVRDTVFSLSQMATGMHVRFVTNATEIYLNYTLALSDKPLWHMPVSGTSGCDLYIQVTGKRWLLLTYIRQQRWMQEDIVELEMIPDTSNLCDAYLLYIAAGLCPHYAWHMLNCLNLFISPEDKNYCC